MTHKSAASQRCTVSHSLAGLLFSLVLLILPALPSVGGQSDPDDLPSKLQTTPSADAIQVDPKAAEQMGIKIAPVLRQRLAIGLKATGQIEALPDRKVAVTAPILGTVVQLLARPNDAVEAGAVVALLSSPELAQLRVEATQKREEAEAERQQAEADLKLALQNETRQQQQASADLNEAKAQVALSQERYDRNRELEAAGAITRRQVQESQAELAASRATLTKAQSQLGELQATNQLSRARAAVAVAQAHLRLSDAAYRARLQQLKTAVNSEGLVTVTAPISGRVVERPITPGETVTVEAASKPLMTIVNAQQVWATANLYEKDLSKVAVGQTAQVTVVSLPNRTFTGRVAQLGAVVEGNTRVVPVKVALDNLRQVLKPGMFAEIRILTDRTPAAVLAIPQTAIVDNNGSPRVFVQQRGGFRPVEVTLGQTAGDFIEVKSGLQTGDRIVTEGAALLYAQSLGGAGIPTDNDDQPKAGGGTKQSQLPDWVLLPIGGTIAGAAFWLGRRTRPRQKRPTPLGNEKLKYETELYLNHFQHSATAHPKREEEPVEPQPPTQE